VKFCECGCGQPAPISPVTNSMYGWVQGHPKRFRQGHATRVFNGRHRHGMTRTPEYRAYHAAKERCTNPNAVGWKDYGGRGIRFLYTSFEQFIAEVGRRPEGMSLDRIDNDGNYEPGNCRWATWDVQALNKRPPARRANADEAMVEQTLVSRYPDEDTLR
jgi:hypothetical protein